MKMVAAAKLKGFQSRMFQARPLGDRVTNMVTALIHPSPPPCAYFSMFTPSRNRHIPRAAAATILARSV